MVRLGCHLTRVSSPHLVPKVGFRAWQVDGKPSKQSAKSNAFELSQKYKKNRIKFISDPSKHVVFISKSTLKPAKFGDKAERVIFLHSFLT